MAKKAQYAKYVEDVQKSPKKEKEPNLPRPQSGKDFLDERNDQRKTLFTFSLWVSSLSLVFLAGMVVTQAVVRINGNDNFEIISEKGLQIIAVAIFGQVFGVVYIIAKAIWSNHEFELPWMRKSDKN
jgi:hypothetical protein